MKIGRFCFLLFPLLLAAAEEKMTVATYMGWYVPYHSGAGTVTPRDFSVLPLRMTGRTYDGIPELAVAAHRAELELLQKHGWNTVGVDGLFYNHAALGNPAAGHRIDRQLQLMRYMTVAASEIPECRIRMIPFLEFIAAYRQMGHEKAVAFFCDNIDLMMKEFGNSPFWRRIGGRPVILLYSTHEFPVEFWREAIARTQAAGHDIFWIMELGGLRPALTGDFDLEKYRPYLELFDGVFNFGCSGLEEAATFPGKIQRVGAGLKAAGYVGATLWPGYLSDRPYNRNFIDHDGTAFLRNVWNRTREASPAFLHWVANDYKEATTLLPSFGTLTSRLEIAERFLTVFNGHRIASAREGEVQCVLSYRKALCSGEFLTLEFLPLPAPGMAGRADVTIRLAGERGETLAERTLPEVDLTKLEAVRWDDALRADRSRSRVIRVSVSVSAGKERRDYPNLPDVAVTPPVDRHDQLYYSIPLHRLAGPERSVELSVNGRNVNAAWHDGLRRLNWTVKGADPATVRFAVAGNGHPLRRMTLPGEGGGDDVLPGQNSVDMKLFKQKPDYGYLDWKLPDSVGREIYYQVLAQFPDGSYAYSPTIWSRPFFGRDELCAQWIFAPSGTERPWKIADATGNFDIVSDPGFKRWPFISLKRRESRALKFNGDLILRPPAEAVPYGPLTLEALFRCDSPPDGNRQYIAFQHGAQANLLVNGDGTVSAQRMRKHRRWPDSNVTVTSKTRLTPGRFHHAAVTYDGRELRLYLDGRLEAAAPCDGTRSNEGFFIGGVPERLRDFAGAGSGRFRGTLLRLSIAARALTESEVARMAGRARLTGL